MTLEASARVHAAAEYRKMFAEFHEYDLQIFANHEISAGKHGNVCQLCKLLPKQGFSLSRTL